MRLPAVRSSIRIRGPCKAPAPCAGQAPTPDWHVGRASRHPRRASASRMVKACTAAYPTRTPESAGRPRRAPASRKSKACAAASSSLRCSPLAWRALTSRERKLPGLIARTRLAPPPCAAASPGPPAALAARPRASPSRVSRIMLSRAPRMTPRAASTCAALPNWERPYIGCTEIVLSNIAASGAHRTPCPCQTPSLTPPAAPQRAGSRTQPASAAAAGTRVHVPPCHRQQSTCLTSHSTIRAILASRRLRSGK